jgi:hypothetical protein
MLVYFWVEMFFQTKIKAMKTCLYLCLCLGLWVNLAQAQGDFYDIDDALQELQTAVSGNYGTRILRMSTGLNAATIENYMKTWRANRCLLRGIVMATVQDLEAQSNGDYTLTLFFPQGKAFLDFAFTNKGLYRFKKYRTEGTISPCSKVNDASNTFYADSDLLGIWVANGYEWHRLPQVLKEQLHTDNLSAEEMDLALQERYLLIQDSPIAQILSIHFQPNKTASVTTSQGSTYSLQWRIQYNQLQIKTGAEWGVWDWRIDPRGNFNLVHDERSQDDTQGKGDIRLLFKRK